MRATANNILTRMGLKTAASWIGSRAIRIMAYPKWSLLLKSASIKLELGSGPKKGCDGWTTIDVSGADICHDLRLGIPLPANSVDQIYTSHMLEHLPYRDLIPFINECFRVLKNGGELSVCVPDASLYIKSYLNGVSFKGVGECYQPAIVDTGSLLDQVNYIAYMDQQHKYMFDSENLINTIKKAPFRGVELREFDLTLDLSSRKFESIFAVATK